jgi:hypothetical protein
VSNIVPIVLLDKKQSLIVKGVKTLLTTKDILVFPNDIAEYPVTAVRAEFSHQPLLVL